MTKKPSTIIARQIFIFRSKNKKTKDQHQLTLVRPVFLNQIKLLCRHQNKKLTPEAEKTPKEVPSSEFSK